MERAGQTVKHPPHSTSFKWQQQIDSLRDSEVSTQLLIKFELF